MESISWREDRRPGSRAERVGRFIGRNMGLVLKGALVVTVLGILLAISPPYDPLRQDVRNRLHPPLSLEGHPLGTDQLGRDMLSNLLVGAKWSVMIGLLVVLISAGVGVTLGVVSGYYGGAADSMIMRVAELQLSLPAFFVALAGAVLLGRGLVNLVGILAFCSWPSYARVARASTLATREKEYIESARSIGAGDARIMLRHVLPSIVGPCLVMAFLQFPAAMMSEATLSFLGFGLPDTIPSLGKTISNGQAYLLRGDWWVSILPGVLLAGIVMTVNLFTDELRNKIDPRSRHR